MKKPWFAVRQELSSRRRTFLAVMSFVLPLLVWSLVSYVPFVWHPQMEIVEPGEVDYFRTGMLVDRAVFEDEREALRAEGRELPTGTRTNPVYLPAPHEVARALYTAFSTEPQRRNEKWLHESLANSIQVIFWGFFFRP
jgi:NitT/TauT family transport system permease protein